MNHGKWREKKLDFALDIALSLLDQADKFNVTCLQRNGQPATLHDAQQQRGTHWQHVQNYLLHPPIRTEIRCSLYMKSAQAWCCVRGRT